MSRVRCASCYTQQPASEAAAAETEAMALQSSSTRLQDIRSASLQQFVAMAEQASQAIRSSNKGNGGVKA